MVYLYFIAAFLLTLPLSVEALTITEKKMGSTSLSQDMSQEMQKNLSEVNQNLKNIENRLRELYAKVNTLFVEGAPEEAFETLLEQINTLKQSQIDIENYWRDLAVNGESTESYALWHQPETTIGQLVMDYGSQGFVYLIPDEVDNIKLSVNSSLPIPRASWEGMLELILVQNGIGYTQLNPFLRQLYLLNQNASGIQLITNQRRDLDFFAPDSRICFVLTPEPAELRRSLLFLEKFINPKSTSLQTLGSDILIIGQVSELRDLLKLYDFIAANKGEKDYRIFAVRRLEAQEMARILAAMFDHVDESEGSSSPPKMPVPNPRDRGASPQRNLPPVPMPGLPRPGGHANGLRVIPLTNVANALFVVGTSEELRKAEQIITQVESQLGDAKEKMVYWYTTKHSNPEELAEILQRVYYLVVQTARSRRDADMRGVPLVPLPTSEAIADDIIAKEIEMLPSELYQTSYYQQGNFLVNPSPIEPRRTPMTVPNQNRDNFIVDLKTGSIAMVIEADYLQTMKDLIKKLDTATPMVRIEVLLFERRIIKENNFGLNLLTIGDCASNISKSCMSWGDCSGFAGILDFMFSREKTCDFPAYDVAYRFLMTQDDIQINANPSVLAINQTPATIAVVQEFSMNTGIYNVETAKGNTLEKAFTRAQYGTTINMTPTIHLTSEDGEESDEPNYVSLYTDITFDDILPGLTPDRPDVVRRHIENEVRVPDGQTIIVGGLRRKTTDDYREMIPFFGELPAIGKFFSKRELSDNETEMFIFLTPTIVTDPLDQLEWIKCEEMRRRPGDIPEFLYALVRARDMEKNRLLANSMDILLGPEPDRPHTPAYMRRSTCGNPLFNAQVCAEYLPESGEYDGR